ncbi:MAG: hypothetical protein UX39_C0031G0002 [Candidatus Magasanikbacteria bacterium GW2011_GWA2_46_17]|uniref:Uncharacterized protein n=1 Tax=Candidatus Magasanikbacteria bacterium GW2011_GWA2_46_17 TaxID=1619042 RepID=A0A0G1NYE4_9BACT|nr:MAG: hypothetical protein UX39_C0031G0002 [Candidatus Magasanikbacteria bacterium GW2011_GWA2_46_17]
MAKISNMLEILNFTLSCVSMYNFTTIFSFVQKSEFSLFFRILRVKKQFQLTQLKAAKAFFYIIFFLMNAGISKSSS